MIKNNELPWKVMSGASEIGNHIYELERKYRSKVDSGIGELKQMVSQIRSAMLPFCSGTPPAVPVFGICVLSILHAVEDALIVSRSIEQVVNTPDWESCKLELHRIELMLKLKVDQFT